MAYYQGDYYRGDPGLLGFLGKTIKGAATGFITGGPLGAIGGAVKTHLRPQTSVARAPSSATFTRWAQPTTIAAPQISPPGPAIMPMMPPGLKISPTTGMPVKRRRRMNVTNDKALRRAVRRTDGFVKLAKRALRGTGYTVVSKSSRARRVNVRESGAGGVTVH